MARIFFVLALFSLGLLGTNLVIGLSIGDLHDASQAYVAARRAVTRVESDPKASDEERTRANEELESALRAYQPIRRRYSLHSLFGLAAALVTVLVNSITVTYFIGTSRWCKEVVETYGLDLQLISRSQQLKRRTFPWAVVGILAILVIVALGAASDPGANFEHGAEVLPWHFGSAVAGLILIAWAFWVQVGNIAANYAIIEEILTRVRSMTK